MNTKVKANEAKFFFMCSDYPDDLFFVSTFDGTDRVASLYSFDITLLSKKHDLIENDFIGQNAVLFIDREGIMVPYAGMITEFSYCSTTVDYSTYKATLHPALWKTTLTHQSRIFQKKNVIEIIKSVLEEHALGYQCNFKVRQQYPQKDYVVQYDETDFNFINRLMSDNGIWYFFEHTPVERKQISSSVIETCVITDSSDSVKPLDGGSKIIFLSQCGLVMHEESKDLEQIAGLAVTHSLVPQKAAVKSYNYRTPELNLSAVANVDKEGHGMVYEYGGNFTNNTEAEKQVNLLASRLKCKKISIKGTSNCTGLSPGKRIEIEEHQRELELEKIVVKDVIITEVSHHGVTLSGYSGNIHTYNNVFHGLPNSVISDFKPECDAHRVIIPGVISAKVEGYGSQYASIDEKGRYKVRMNFDRSDTGNSEGSKYLRMAQPYSGPEYGMHCPLHENAEIVVAHVNGNPDKPLGLGSVPDGNTISPVKSGNKFQSMLKTAGNNELTLDDTDGKQKFIMSTPYNQFFSAGHNQSVSITADRFIHVDNNETKDVTGNQKLTVGVDREVTVTGDKLEEVKGVSSIEVSGDSDETCSSERKLEVVGHESKEIDGSRLVTITGDYGVMVKGAHSVSVGGNHSVKAGSSVGIESNAMITIQASGNITIKGANDLVNGKAAITITAGSGSIAMTPAGITITAPQVTLSGTEVTIGASAVNTLLAGIITIN